jgi:hypothetical protein
LEVELVEKKLNCWEFMKCGREAGGINAKIHGVCPAYPHYGRNCIKVAGTQCDGKVSGTFAMKILDCIECKFFQSDHHDHTYKKYSTG